MMRRRKNRGAEEWRQKEPGGNARQLEEDFGRGIARQPEEEPSRGVAQRGEAGSGTLLTIGVIAAILSACALITVLLGVHVTRVRSQNGADMAALAGAEISRTGMWVAVGDQPCEQARQAAQRNDVHLKSCEVLGLDVRVEVSAQFGPWHIHARARAGPENPEGVSGSGAAPSQPGPAGAGPP